MYKSDVTTSFINIFNDVIELPENQRLDYLNKHYGKDQTVIAELKSMLDVYAAKPDAFLENSSAQKPFVDRSSETIGNYQLISHIGSGGMGDVYKAKRIDGVSDATVALKIFSHAKNKDTELVRFHQERRLLSRLNSPYIAKLFDGGNTANDEPYFVMEHVEGLSIIDYCEINQLSLNDRLKLFVKVCYAVHHAHQHLIVHRDLKPSNILVTPDDQPKLLDFGIAQILQEQDMGELTEPVSSIVAGVPMTPLYASPEQFLGLSPTPASDIYSLGTILFQLLANQSPYNIDTPSNFTQLRDAICTKPVTKPSFVIRLNQSQSSAVSSNSVKPDLDDIVLKCLSKDPEDRYQLANNLADDIERYLRLMPVSFKQDKLDYVLLKKIQRNIVTSAAIAMSLVTAISIGAIQQNRVIQERNDAVQAEERSGRVVELLVDVFRLNDPSRPDIEDISAREILDNSTNKIKEELSQQPELQVDFYLILARIYRNLGDYEKSRDLTDSALTLVENLQPDDYFKIGEINSLYGKLARIQGDYQTAKNYFERSLEHFYKADYTEALAFSSTHMELGIVLEKLSEYDRAIAEYEKALQAAQASSDDLRHEQANIYSNAGVTYWYKGDLLGAIEQYEKAVELYSQALGEEHLDVAMTNDNIGLAYSNLGELDKALNYYEKSLSIKDKVYTEEHYNLGITYSNIGIIYSDKGDFETAIDYYKKAEAIYINTLGPDHPFLADTYTNFATAYARQKQFDLAINYFKMDLAISEQALGKEHPQVGSTYSSLAGAYTDIGDFELALEYFSNADRIFENKIESNHPFLAAHYLGYAELYVALNKIDIAKQYYERTYQIEMSNKGEDHSDVQTLKSQIEGLK